MVIDGGVVITCCCAVLARSLSSHVSAWHFKATIEPNIRGKPVNMQCKSMPTESMCFWSIKWREWEFGLQVVSPVAGVSPHTWRYIKRLHTHSSAHFPLFFIFSFLLTITAVTTLTQNLHHCCCCSYCWISPQGAPQQNQQRTPADFPGARIQYYKMCKEFVLKLNEVLISADASLKEMCSPSNYHKPTDTVNTSPL